MNKQDELTSVDKDRNVYSKCKQQISSNKADSLVDIDTVNGKVTANPYIVIDPHPESQPRAKEYISQGETQKVFNLTLIYHHVLFPKYSNIDSSMEVAIPRSQMSSSILYF